MSLIDVPLKSFVYRFRRLGWAEELSVRVPKGLDPRTALLATALHDVSGLQIKSYDEALLVIKRIPETIRWRFFVLYRGNLPADRYYKTEALFEAPEPTTFSQRLDREDAGDGSQSVPSVPVKASRWTAERAPKGSWKRLLAKWRRH